MTSLDKRELWGILGMQSHHMVEEELHVRTENPLLLKGYKQFFN